VKKLKKNRIFIGTRGSKLALWQAEWVKAELEILYPEFEIELVKIKTTGDKILDVPLAAAGGKGLFVKEIEESLLRHNIDIAVHSMKDVPTEFPDGLHLAAVCKREDPRDALILSKRSNPPTPLIPPLSRGESGGGKKVGEGGFGTHRSLLFTLPHGARIGTSSLRRSCQLLNIRPDLKIKNLRGNLDTRLRKLDEGQFDAIILAAAGVKRLGLENRITELFPFEVSLPAIGQGAIGVECRIDYEFVNKLIAPLNHPETFKCVKAERAFLKRLEGGCQVPIAAYARIIGKESRVNSHSSLLKSGDQCPVTNDRSVLIMDGLVGSLNGEKIIRSHIEGNPEQAEFLGTKMAEDILSRGAKEILDEVYKRSLPR
jgi:hydroxymethylbilane synthase